MGQSSSSSVYEYVTNNTEINDSVTNSIEVQNNTTTANYQINSNVIDVGVASVCCAGFSSPEVQKQCLANIGPLANGDPAQEISCGNAGLNIIQSGNLNIKVSKQVTADSNASLINSVADQLSAQLTAAVNQSNKAALFSTTFDSSNSSVAVSNIKNSFVSDLNVSLSQDIQSNYRANSGQVNYNKISLCNGTIKGNGCNISQTFSFELYVTSVIGCVAATASKNDEVVKAFNWVKDNTKQTNTNWLSDIFDQFGSAVRWMVLAIAIFAIVFVVVGGFVLIRTTKNKKGNGGKS